MTMSFKNGKILYRDGSDEYGPTCLKPLTTLQGIRLGKIKDTFGWLEYVGEPKDFPSKSVSNGVETSNKIKDTLDNLS